MKPVQAIILDVYGTLLEVTPVTETAPRARAWDGLWCETLGGGSPAIPESELAATLRAVVARHHEEAQARGIRYPEVCWSEVVAEVFPAVRRLDQGARRRFEAGLAALPRRLRLMPGCAEVLRAWRARGAVLGIASNAQPYTLDELGAALSGAGLGLDLFEPHLRVWSFDHGFSKPDPHVFRILEARLAARGIPAGATLMIGDREDNDVMPARAAGWQAWHLTQVQGRDWESLGRLVSIDSKMTRHA